MDINSQTPPKNLDASPSIDHAWLARVITSFDQLSVLLVPESAKRLPTSPQKFAGEIKPRTKTIQQTLRSVRVFAGEYSKQEEIARYLDDLRGDVDAFLGLKEVRGLLRAGKEGNDGFSRPGSERGNDVAIRRRRDALGFREREKLVVEMKSLEERVRGGLLAIENVLWPRRIIKLGPSIEVKDRKEAIKEEGTWKGVKLQASEVFEWFWDVWDELFERLGVIFAWAKGFTRH